jgi:hypothetical protein
MKIIIDEQPRMSLEKFGDMCELTLRITERPTLRSDDLKNLTRWYASFDHVEVIRKGMLYSVYGNGNTIREAIENYVENLSNERIVIKAASTDRREVRVPKLTIGNLEVPEV